MIQTNTAITIMSKKTCIDIVMEGRSYCYPSQPLVNIQKFHPSVPVQHTGSRQKFVFRFKFMQVQFQGYCPMELYQFLLKNAITIHYYMNQFHKFNPRDPMVLRRKKKRVPLQMSK
ncbi:hypothetical protein D0463_03540 [Bacillus sp. V59.32b]|nr:hypothetical protein D0463_03540 [Bacillus sp. V59.32b]